MNVNSHTEMKYNLEVTQDEYVAIVAALATADIVKLQGRYLKDLSDIAVNNMEDTIIKLMGDLYKLYKKTNSTEIIKSIRLEGYNIDGFHFNALNLER